MESGSAGEGDILQMNLRSVWGKEESDVGQIPVGPDDDARTLPIRRVYSYGLDFNQDFMITRHRDGYFLNQRGAVLNSDCHQSLRLWKASGGDLPVE